MISTRWKSHTIRQANLQVGWRLILVVGLISVAPTTAFADATAKANSNNWYFYRFDDQSTTSSSYNFASSALAATFSYAGQAWNEGGTSGAKTFGPAGKFNNVAGAPAAKTWPTFIGAKVPAPGTTEAEASFVGFSYVDTGFVATVVLSRYGALSSAFAQVKQATIPAGGFGKAEATVNDPWAVDVPIADSGDLLQMHANLDLSGSALSPSDPLSSGQMNWHASLDGVSAFQSYLLDYTVGDSASTFSSSLAVASGVQIFLNDPANWSEGADWTSGLAYNRANEVTPAQLKTYLDSFQTSDGGWSLGSTPVSIGLQFAIPNDAVGLGGDPDSRHFLLHQDASSETMAAAPAPEPDTLALAGLGLLTLGVFARRNRRRD